MSVIAWDGKVIAADCQGDRSGLKFKSHKIRSSVGGYVVGWCGDAERGELAARWYEAGAIPANYPKCMDEDVNKGESFTRLVVVRNGRCFTYENYPVPQHADQPFIAFGVGRDFAMGAMEMGATAVQAVEVAIKHSPYCGFGVDAFEVGGEKNDSPN